MRSLRRLKQKKLRKKAPKIYWTWTGWLFSTRISRTRTVPPTPSIECPSTTRYLAKQYFLKLDWAFRLMFFDRCTLICKFVLKKDVLTLSNTCSAGAHLSLLCAVSHANTCAVNAALVTGKWQHRAWSFPLHHLLMSSTRLDWPQVQSLTSSMWPGWDSNPAYQLQRRALSHQLLQSFKFVIVFFMLSYINLFLYNNGHYRVIRIVSQICQKSKIFEILLSRTPGAGWNSWLLVCLSYGKCVFIDLRSSVILFSAAFTNLVLVKCILCLWWKMFVAGSFEKQLIEDVLAVMVVVPQLNTVIYD